LEKLYTIYNIQFGSKDRRERMITQPFQYVSHAQEVMFGAGVIEQLGIVLRNYPWHRFLLCTSPHLAKSGRVAQLQAILGDALVAVYSEVQSHVPDHQVEECLAIAEAHTVDAVIGMGGGSPIGMAKAVAHALEVHRSGTESSDAKFPTEQPRIPTIAIPTTYAGSEMTPIYGVTRHEPDGSTRKVTVSNSKITPKVVVYDPELTLDLPPDLTASTGINALAHCIEAIYSITRNPLSTASALLGIRYLRDFLLRCTTTPTDIEARSGVLIGAHMAGKALASVEIGVHHGTCHVLGGTAGVPHGIANTIILPHAIRYNSDYVGALIALAGESLGVERGQHSDTEVAYCTAQAVHDFILTLGLPQRLRDVGVAESLLPTLAETMLKSKAVQNNPKPVLTVEDAMSILQAAW
jgi:maleylacetate reductase